MKGKAATSKQLALIATVAEERGVEARAVATVAEANAEIRRLKDLQRDGRGDGGPRGSTCHDHDRVVRYDGPRCPECERRYDQPADYADCDSYGEYLAKFDGAYANQLMGWEKFNLRKKRQEEDAVLIETSTAAEA